MRIPRWPPFLGLGTPTWPPRRQVKTLYMDYWQAGEFKMAGYWPRSFLACLWTATGVVRDQYNLLINSSLRPILAKKLSIGISCEFTLPLYCKAFLDASLLIENCVCGNMEETHRNQNLCIIPLSST